MLQNTTLCEKNIRFIDSIFRNSQWRFYLLRFLSVHIASEENKQAELQVSLASQSVEQARDEVLTYLDKTVLVARQSMV